jgi:hypothetical protein
LVDVARDDGIVADGAGAHYGRSPLEPSLGEGSPHRVGRDREARGDLNAGLAAVTLRPLADRRQLAAIAELDTGAAKHIADDLAVHPHPSRSLIAGQT